jgi:hypothetical protein
VMGFHGIKGFMGLLWELYGISWDLSSNGM